MEDNRVYIVWVSDVWFSHANSSIVAVCSTMDKAISLALEYAENTLGVKPNPTEDETEENCTDCEEEFLEDVIDDLRRDCQWSNNYDSLRIEIINLDEIQ